MSGNVWYISVNKKKIEFKKYPSKQKNKKTIKKSNQKSTNSTKKLLINLILASSLIFFLSMVSAAEINDTFHINLQTTFSNGTIETGTFTFAFNITESSDSSCLGPIVYNHSVQKTTDTRGIISLYLPTTGSGGGDLSALSFDKQYYLCYYRSGVLKDVSQLGRVPYAFRATQVNLSEISVDSNLNMIDQYNITDVKYGFFQYLGSLLEGITKLFATDVNISNNLDVGGDVNVTGNVFSQNKNLTLGYEYAINYTGTAGIGDCPSGQFVQNTTTGGVECTAPAGGGDITGVFTTLDNYLYNGSSSGDVYLRFNGTKLNETIDTRITSSEGELHVNMSDYWNTGDRGALRNISQIQGSWLTNDLSWINFTDGDTRYILITDEPDLNVNRSEWWRTSEGDLNNVEDILGSWLTNDLVWINFSQGDTQYLLITDEANLNVNASDYWITDEGVKKNVVDVLGSEITNDLGWINQTQGDALYVPLGRTLTAGDGLVGGGNLIADREFAVAFGTDFLGWANLTDYPDECPAGHAVKQIGDTLTCINISSQGSETLDGYDSTFFMPLNTSVVGNFSFNGGWTGGGLSIIEGDIYAQTLYVYNISSLEVTHLKINGSLIPDMGGQFDLGSSDKKWRDLWISRDTSIGGDLSLTGTMTSGTVPWVRLSDYPYIIAGTGLEGGGDLSTNRTLSLTNTGVSAGGYGSTTINYPRFTVDAQGRITSAANQTIRSATTSVSGITTLTASVTSTANDSAATPWSVKTAYDLAASKLSTETDPYWTGNQSSYSTTAEILAFGYYNESDFVITDYFTKSDILGFGYYNLTDFDIADYFTSSEVLAFNYYNASDFDIADYFTSAQILGFNYYNSTDFVITDYYTKTEIDGFGFYNITDFDINDYYTKTQVYNKTEVDGFSLSKWIDDLGDRGYTHLTNFTDDILWTSGFNATGDARWLGVGEESDPLWTGNFSNVAFINKANAFGAFNQSFDTNVLFVDATNDRVGIGTTIPQQLLHVNGSAVINGTLNMDSNKIISLGNGTSAQDAITLSQLQAVNATATGAGSMDLWRLAASGTAGTQDIVNNTLVNFTAGTGVTVTRSGSTITTGLADTAVTPGSYGGNIVVGRFTVDQQGRLTSASNTTIRTATTSVSGITTLTASVATDTNTTSATPWGVKVAYDTAAAKASPGTCPSGQFVQNTTTGGVECDAPAGAGDITGVFTTLDNYLYNGSSSGDVYLRFNGTRLNETIDLRENDTTYTVSGNLLNLTGTTFSVNEGTLTTNKGCKYVTGTGIVCDQDYLTSYTETDPYWTGNQSSYSTTAEILAFGYYNASDFVITDYFTKTDILGFSYYNLTDFDITDYFTSSEVLAFNYYNLTDFDIADYFTAAQILGFNYYNSSDFVISDYYTKSEIESFNYYNLTDFDINDYYTKTQVYNKTEVDGFSLSKWTDDLGNRGYTHLTNFTDDILWTSGFNATGDTRWLGVGEETDPLWTGNQSSYSTTATILGWNYYNSTDFSISDYYLKSNPFGFYNSTNPQTETDPLWTGNQSSYYNKTYVYNTTEIDDFTLSHWTDDLGNRGYTHLTNFTDNLGDRGYTHLTNFTDDILWTAGFNATGDARWLGVGEESDPLWTGNQSLVYLKSNPFSFVNTTTASDLNYLILSKWANITDAPTNLSFFTDDLGNRGYTHLTNFTDDILWTSGFNATGDTRWLGVGEETDPLWTGNSTLVPYLASANTFTANNIFNQNLTVDTDTLFVDSNTGRVGIGTTSPEQRLHLTGNILAKSTGTALGILSRGAITNYAGFQFQTAGVTKWTVGTRNDSTENLHFFDTATRLFIERTTGNVGIGTISPQQKLHVNGSAIINGTLNMNSNKIISLANGTSSQDAITLSQLQEVNASAVAEETDPLWTANQSSYSTTAEILAFGYYNASDFVITDYFTKTDILGFGYYNLTDFDIADYFTSSEVLAFNYYNATDFDIVDYFTAAEILGFNYYNSTDFVISDYYTKTEIDGFGFYNLTDFDINDYYTKTQVYNKTEVDVFSLSHWTDDLGDRGYTHLTNFTDDILWTAGFNATGDARWLGVGEESDPLWTGNQSSYSTTATILGWNYYNSTDFSISDYYLKSNPFGFYNSTNPQTETDPLWTGNQSLVYLKSNPFSFVNTSTASNLNYLILSKWANITDAPTTLSFFTDDLGDRGYTHLTNFTDNLGDRGYTHLTNFTDDILWTTGFNATGDARWLGVGGETDPLWTGNQSSYSTTATILGWNYYNSTDFSISDYYLKSNPFGFYNSTNPQTETDPLWTANQSSYWDTSTDLDTVISDDEIAEGKIAFSTACAAGNHYYLNGNDLACEADDDTTYSASGTLLDLTGTTFSVNAGTLTTNKGCKFVTGTGIVCDQDYLTSFTETDPKWTGNYSAKTGTGNVVYSTSPTLVTPILGAATATTLDTGYGANELWDMDQHVLQASSPTFASLNLNGETKTSRDGATTYENLAHYYQGATSIGTILICIGSTPNIMLDAEISVQGYNGLGKYHVRGYTYTSTTTWHMPAASYTGSGNKYPVRFAKKTSNNDRCILIGTTSTDWGNYLHVSVPRVTVGYGTPNIGNWEITLITDESGLSNITGVDMNLGAHVFSGALTATTIDTGYGANELWDMDQHVLTSSDVQFGDINSTGLIYGNGSQLTDIGETSPAGTEGAIQYNDDGSFGGNSSLFFFNETSGRLGIGTTTPRALIEVSEDFRETIGVGWGGEYADFWWDSHDNYGFWFTNRVNNTGAHTIFRFASDVTDAENMELQANGDVMMYYGLSVGVVDSKLHNAKLLIEGTDYISTFYANYREEEDIFLYPGTLGGNTYIPHGELILANVTDPMGSKLYVDGNITFTDLIYGNGSQLTGIEGEVTDIWVNESGDTMTGDLTVGSTGRTANTYVRSLAGDAYIAGFEAYGSSQGTGYFYAGQSTTHGGGMFYNGDGTPAFATGESADRISFYRNNAGTKEVVFSYPYSGNDVAFRGGLSVAGTFDPNGAVTLPTTGISGAGSGSGLDADKLDGYHGASASTANTYALRDASGDINTRLFRSEYDSTNPTINYIMTQIDTASNNYIRPSTPAQLVTALGLEAGGTRDIWVEKGGDTMSGLLTWGTNNPNPAIRVRHVEGKASASAVADTLYLQYSAAGKGVVIGDSGTDHPLTVYGTVTAPKITTGTIDPVYTIDGEKYATYVASMAGGVKEEVTGTVMLKSNYTIEFDKLEKGSDLWLFYQTTDFGLEMENLQIFLTPSFDGNVWYEKNPLENALTIHGESSGEVSYRMTANRFDWMNWSNYYIENNTDGLIAPLK